MADSEKSWFEDTYDLLVSGIRFLAKVIDERFKAIFSLVTICVCLAVGLLVYDTYGRKEFVLLTGPAGSAGYDYSSEIVEASRKNSSDLSLHRFTPKVTDGFHQNTQQISSDDSGTHLGFAHDGFGDSTNVRILLPLEESYLHILCSRHIYDKLLKCCDCEILIEEAAPEDPGTTPLPRNTGNSKATVTSNDLKQAPKVDIQEEDTQKKKNADGSEHYVHLGFYELICLLQDYREKCPTINLRDVSIATGPEKSGTKQIAELVLEHFQIKPEFYSHYEVSNWDNIKKELSRADRSEVDIAFYLGPKNAPFVKEIVQRGHVFLLGLGEDAHAIADAMENPIAVSIFRPGLFGRVELYSRKRDTHLKLTSRTKNETLYVEHPCFCNTIQTLKTRRVLIGSKWMSDEDAFSLATFARDSLSERIPKLDWENSLAPDASSDHTSYAFRFHPGAKLVRDEKEPETSAFLSSLATALFIPVILLAVGQGARRLNQRLSDEPTNLAATQTEEGNEQVDPASEKSEVGQEVTEDINDLPSKKLYDRFVGVIEEMQEQLLLEPLKMTPSKRNSWSKKLTNMEHRLVESKKTGRLTTEQVESLSVALKEFKHDLPEPPESEQPTASQTS